MFEVERKCILYSFWASVRGSPAGMNRKLLCSFHFLERLPEVSPQYNQIGKHSVRWPFASSRHRFPVMGLVSVHAEWVLESGLTTSVIRVR
jgi:hypothetical protein